MKTRLLSTLTPFFGLLLFLAVVALSACSPVPASTGKPVVLCTIFAYYDAARAIAKGTPVKVILPLPPRVSPHEFEASPSEKSEAVGTTLYVKNGLLLDDRFDKLIDGSSARTLVIANQIPPNLLLHTQEVSLDPATTTSSAAAGESREDTPLGNPHIWLDPMIQIKATEAIRDALINLDPADKDAFAANAAAYIADINKLDADFKAAAATFKSKDFIGFHSAYDYLAHRYGLRQIASIEEIPGDGLTPAQAEKIIGLINDNKIKYVAVETGLSDRSMSLIKSKTGVQTITLEPLEAYNNLNDSYVSLMRRNLESLKTVLGK
jgi:zinc/manganese transport system substrate-binding protein